ncbi:MAG: hypothetical protein J6Q15_00145, partial [Clostridia bacterium]|nr:hypothetical protein [Clostridia bacterium]
MGRIKKVERLVRSGEIKQIEAEGNIANYEVLKPSISILIADYRLDKSKEISHYHSKWNLREENHKDLKLTNDIELH